MLPKRSRRPQFSVRPAFPGDLPGVLRLEQTVNVPPWGEEFLSRQLQDPRTSCLVATLGGDPVGYTLYRFCSKGMTLPRLAVAEPYRRMGIGRALVGEVLTRFRQFARPKLIALVPETDLGAHLLLKSFGFRATRVLTYKDYPCCYEFILEGQKPASVDVAERSEC